MYAFQCYDIKKLLTPAQTLSQNLSPFNPKVEMGIAPLQSVVELSASKKVANSGQSLLKNTPSTTLNLVQTQILSRPIIKSIRIILSF